MKKYLSLAFVCVVSSLLSVYLYSRFLQSPRGGWSGNVGEVQYVGLVDKLFSNRSNSRFQSASPTNFIESAAIATPAVVNVRAVLVTGSSIFGGGSTSGSSGSGVILSPDGYIVTNHHVVDHGTDIKVTLSDKRTYNAKLIGSDPSTDIALLKIEEADLPFVLFGNSDSVSVGEWVLAVGNPLQP